MGAETVTLGASLERLVSAAANHDDSRWAEVYAAEFATGNTAGVWVPPEALLQGVPTTLFEVAFDVELAAWFAPTFPGLVPAVFAAGTTRPRFDAGFDSVRQLSAGTGLATGPALAALCLTLHAARLDQRTTRQLAPFDVPRAGQRALVRPDDVVPLVALVDALLPNSRCVSFETYRTLLHHVLSGPPSRQTTPELDGLALGWLAVQLAHSGTDPLPMLERATVAPIATLRSVLRPHRPEFVFTLAGCWSNASTQFALSRQARAVARTLTDMSLPASSAADRATTLWGESGILWLLEELLLALEHHPPTPAYENLCALAAGTATTSRHVPGGGLCPTGYTWDEFAALAVERHDPELEASTLAAALRRNIDDVGGQSFATIVTDAVHAQLGMLTARWTQQRAS